jgi:hypothetical protein
MSDTVFVGAGYRRLQAGEVRQKGDEFFDPQNERWIKTYGTGLPIRGNDAAFTYRRRVIAETKETEPNNGDRYSDLLSRLYWSLRNGGYGSDEYAEIMEQAKAAMEEQEEGAG